MNGDTGLYLKEWLQKPNSKGMNQLNGNVYHADIFSKEKHLRPNVRLALIHGNSSNLSPQTINYKTINTNMALILL